MLDPFQPEKRGGRRTPRSAPAGGPRRLHRSGQVAPRPALADDPDLFTGAFWSGERAVALGLADRVGDLRTVLRERYGDKVVLKTLSGEKGFLRRLRGLPATDAFAGAVVDRAAALLEERSLWGRFGL